MTETKDIHLTHLMELCSASEIAPGCATKVEKDGLSLAVFNIDNEYYVTDDLCTHGPGSLSEGEIDGDIVECDFHNGAFNIKTGEVAAPPCMLPLRTYAVHSVDGKIYIDPDQPAFSLSNKVDCPKASQ